MSERHDQRDSGPVRPRVIEMEPEPRPQRRAGGARVIETERRGRIVPAEPPPVPAVVAPTRRRRSRLLSAGLAGLAVFFVGVLSLAAFDWIASLAARDSPLAGLAILFVVAGVGGTALIAWHELGSLARLRNVETVQRRFAGDIPADQSRSAIADLLAVLPQTRDCAAGITAFQARVQLHHDAAEQVEILKQTVVRPLDRRAEAAVRKAALRAFGITALSPTALTDAAFFLAVSLRMLREIAEVYGLRPTAASTAHLLRRLIREAGTLGAIDLVSAGLMQHLGAGAAERLSSAAGESLYAAQRMARLGIAVMQLVRPLAFTPDELPSLTSLVAGLLSRTPPAER
jgi:putative membrane protein